MRSWRNSKAIGKGASVVTALAVAAALIGLTWVLTSSPAGSPGTSVEAGSAGIAPTPAEGREPVGNDPRARPRKLVVADPDQVGTNSGTGTGTRTGTDADTDEGATAPRSGDTPADRGSDEADPSGTPNPSGTELSGNQPAGPATKKSPSPSSTEASKSTGRSTTASTPAGADASTTSKPPTTAATSTTVRPTTTSTTRPATTRSTQPAGRSERFRTLPPGSALPTGSDCAARVRATPENVPENRPYNQRRGQSVAGRTMLSAEHSVAPNNLDNRIDGNFVGTTDEIIQWGACKWGFDEDHVRAQAYAESTWFAGQLGDCGHNTQSRTRSCASVGILQVRAAALPDSAHPGVWPWVWDSTAMNVDYALAVKRLCYEGLETWLTEFDNHGSSYGAGDEWGCAGRWFSGGWHDSGSKQYVQEVKARLRQRDWETKFVGCPNWQQNRYCSDGSPRGF